MAEIETQRLEALKEQAEAQGMNRTTKLAFASSTLLGLVSLYPIIHGTRTHDHTMLLAGFIIALVSFKILPLEKVVDLVKAWRGRAA